MKFLVVTGDNVIFEAVARELAAAIGGAHEIVVAVEAAPLRPWRVLRDRLRRSGVVKGLDQFAFKVFDMLVLRRREEREARRRCGDHAPAVRLPSLNSAEGLDYLRAGRFDVVVCIATSIIGREALAIPTHGLINIHPGVLPGYRGTGNLWAVAGGDWSRVGYTVHWMSERIDVGKIIAIGAVENPPDGLWALHVAALRAAVFRLAAIIREGTLLSAEVDVAAQSSRYFGWYGFADYLRFARMSRRRRRGI